ncbi:MAG TPA: DUF1549 domain-containing protein, partial [Pirellulaceae bacterium]|nr:DUF1549 domain-containing protein [Pirellulaceae bacterium]
MPPKHKLAAADVEKLRAWIAAGAPTANPEPDDIAALDSVTAEERSYWAFQPIAKPTPPSVRTIAAVRTPVDQFLLSRLEAAGLNYSTPAPRHTLARRLTYDLTGLPPTAEDMSEFEKDDGPDAVERFVDRLLASPRYGERWGRHWLDAAGYADSDGYSETDPLRPYAYKYRDYVIRATNSDKPLDQFIIEQLAGDELVPQPYANLTHEQIERLVATGFLRTVIDGSSSGAAPKEAANAVVAETIKVVSSSLLGLTVGCAQCHDHRYDPIPQSDYYRLRAVFEPALNWKSWRAPAQRLVSLATDADRAESARIEEEAKQLEAKRVAKQNDYIAKTLEKELAKIAEDQREAVRSARAAAPDKRTEEQKQLLKAYPSVNVDAGSLYLYDAAAAADLKKDAEQIAEVRKKKPVEDFVNCLNEPVGPLPETFLFSRGDPDQPKQSLTPSELTVLVRADSPALPVKDPQTPTSGRRLAYARQLVDGRHPLTARVLANRFWMHHFGRGIVATAGDFGTLGERPTHPELLDWLATRLMNEGRAAWSLKSFHRELLTSTAFRQSSRRGAAGEATDPDNRLLWRMPVRRLDAESLRDSVLAVNGMLNMKAFGAAVPVMEDDVGQIVIGIENKNGENRPGPIIPMHGEDYRRSVYVQVRRTRPLAVLDTFDLPSLEPNCTGRASSTVTPQSLLLMNSDFTLTESKNFADRLKREAGSDPAAQVKLGWRVALGREPD